MIEYAYDFNFEKCFACKSCRYDMGRREHYCDKTHERIDNPHAGRCGDYERI